MRRRTARQRPAPTTPRRAARSRWRRGRPATTSVGVVDDQLHDGGETLTLALANPSRPRLTDAVASGTINNSDPLPRALLACFGRAAGLHVVEQVEEQVRVASRAGFGCPLRRPGATAWRRAGRGARSAAVARQPGQCRTGSADSCVSMHRCAARLACNPSWASV